MSKDGHGLKDILKAGETLTVEFKSDQNCLPDRELVAAHGAGRGRTYTLSVKVYRKAGQKAGYVRQAGFDPIQQEQMVLAYIEKHGAIKRGDVAELCRLSLPQAYHLLKRLENQGKIKQIGGMRHAVYKRNV